MLLSRILRPVLTGVLSGALLACGPSAGREPPEKDPEEETARALREIANLGYVAGVEPATEEAGVVHHDPEQAQPGLNFYNSAHAAAACLTDMEGRVLHSWHGDFDRAFARLDETVPQGPLGHTWRRAKLIDDGFVLAIHENVGLVKLDRDSNVVWSRLNRAHHDLDVDEAGRIYVICREVQYEPRFGDLNPVLLDYIRIYDADGRFIDSISIDQAYKESEYSVTTEPGQPERDIYHANTVQLLDGVREDRHPAFRKGNLLLSFRSLDEIAVLDPVERRIVWRMRGPWKQQHEPVELGNGHLLVFDNIGLQGKGGPARILEIDPLSEEVVWTYDGPAEDPVRSLRAGSVQRLGNGNTLIVSSAQGRVIEVTPAKEVVWEFLNPNHTGREQERRAGIFEFKRIDPSTAGWLDRSSWDETPEG